MFVESGVLEAGADAEPAYVYMFVLSHFSAWFDTTFASCNVYTFDSKPKVVSFLYGYEQCWAASRAALKTHSQQGEACVCGG